MDPDRSLKARLYLPDVLSCVIGMVKVRIEPQEENIMHVLRAILIGLILLILAVGACAGLDFNAGTYARCVGMGGAGIAVDDDMGEAMLINPAAAISSPGRQRFIFHGIDVHSRGAKWSEISNDLDEVTSGSTLDSVRLIRTYGDERTTMTFYGLMGTCGNLGITVEGEAQGIVNPSDNFMIWTLLGQPTTPAQLVAAGLVPAPGNPAQVAAYAATLANGSFVAGSYLYALPAVTVGTGMKTRAGGFYVGAKLKLLHSYVRRWNITSGVVGTDIALDATEVPGVSDTGFGADLGFLYKPYASKLQFGLLINNAVDAGLQGVETPTTWSVGAAMKMSPRWLAVADLANLNDAYDEGVKLRLGAEYMVSRRFALRGGYSGDSFTLGLSYLGWNFAVSSDVPLLYSRAFRF